MRRLAIALVLIGCSHANKEATPAGTKVFDWTLAQATRPAIKTAVLDAKHAQDRSDVFAVFDDEVKLKLHVETATAKYDEGGTAVTISTVIALSATVESGADYTFGPGTCDGPNYELKAPGEMPGFTILDCQLRATKPNTSGLLFFQMKGDGSILPAPKATQVFKSP